MNRTSGEQGNFLAEAQLALDDLDDKIVSEKKLSNLNNPNNLATGYLNIKLKNAKEFCIELTRKGYRIVGYHYDNKSQPLTKYYESLQALLTNESDSYVDNFARSLEQKLLVAQRQLQEEEDEDDEENND